MEVVFSQKAIKDYNYWLQTNNLKVQERIKQLLVSIERTPYTGIGKPEGLKHQLRGSWSRRIDKEHRLVYEIDNETINVLSMKGHY